MCPNGAVGHNFERDPPETIPARFGLILFSGFRGEDLNVIFYQNILKKSSPRKLLSQYQPNFAELILGWPLS
jgi:hypothetical protein